MAAILGWAILDEPLTPHIALAAAIIIVAVAIITVQKNQSAQAKSKFFQIKSSAPSLPLHAAVGLD